MKLISEEGYLDKFKKILGEAYILTSKKHSDYGDSTWRVYGLKMRFADIWRKFARLESLIWDNNKQKVGDESVRDTLLDLLVYSAMAIILYDEERSNERDRQP